MTTTIFGLGVLTLALTAAYYFRYRGGETGATTSIRGIAEGDDEHRSYEERTYDELYELAAERDITGRSYMKKDELIEALREQRGS